MLTWGGEFVNVVFVSPRCRFHFTPEQLDAHRQARVRLKEDTSEDIERSWPVWGKLTAHCLSCCGYRVRIPAPPLSTPVMKAHGVSIEAPFCFSHEKAAFDRAKAGSDGQLANPLLEKLGEVWR